MPYQPAADTTQSATLAHLATVFYERTSLDKLYAMLRFASVCEPHPLSKGQGKTIQMKRYTLPGANVTPSAEGVVGSPLTNTSSTISATIEQYSDFMSSSTLLEWTDISDTVMEMIDNLSYRAALTTDVIIRTEADSSATPRIATLGASFTAQDAKRANTLMSAANVLPREGMNNVGIIHPYIVYDLISDNTAGGFIESLKYQAGMQVLNGEVGMAGNVRWLSSTNVSTSGAAPNVLYRTYVFGKGGLGIVELSGKGPSHISDPSKQHFALNTISGGPSPSDPEGQIGTYVSYYFVMAAKILDSTDFRYRVVEADASLV